MANDVFSSGGKRKPRWILFAFLAVIMVSGGIGVYFLLQGGVFESRSQAGETTISVCASGCDVTTIKNALLAANDTDVVIFLDTDLYTENSKGLRVATAGYDGVDYDVKLRSSVKNIVIKGRGRESTRWNLQSASDNKYLLSFANGISDTPSLSIEDVHVDLSDRIPADEGINFFEISNVNIAHEFVLSFENVGITDFSQYPGNSSSPSTLVVSPLATSIQLTNVTAEDFNIGVRFSGGRLSINGSDFNNFAEFLQCDDTCNVTVHDSSFTDGLFNVFNLFNSSSLELENSIIDHVDAAVRLGSESYAKLVKNSILNVMSNALYGESGSRADIFNNLFYGNNCGVFLNEVTNTWNFKNNVFAGNDSCVSFLANISSNSTCPPPPIGTDFCVVDGEICMTGNCKFPGGAITISGGSSSIQLKNNIFYRNSAPGIGVYNRSDTSNISTAYNAYYENKILDFSQSFDVIGASSGHSNILVDPMLNNPASFDFLIPDNSPCKGSGENGADIGLTGGEYSWVDAPPPPDYDCTVTNQAIDCDDGKSCTEDSCFEGSCLNLQQCPTGESCNASGDCESIFECAVETQTVDCNDGKSCTEDSCFEGACLNIPGCPTGESCNASGACEANAECTVSTQESDCNDNLPCTVDSCVDGGCSHQDSCDSGSYCASSGSCALLTSDTRLLNIQIDLQLKTNDSASVVIDFYAPGDENPLYEFIVESDESGTISNVDISSLPANIYLMKVKPRYYLSQSRNVTVGTDNIDVTFDAPFLAGDLNDDDMILTADYVVYVSELSTMDELLNSTAKVSIADLDGDGYVKTLDYIFMSNNWTHLE